MSAYELGYKAGQSGKTIFECPYSPTSHHFDYRDWMRGFDNGLRDRLLNKHSYSGEWL